MQFVHHLRAPPDLTKAIRQNYKTPPAQPYNAEYVRQRTDVVRQLNRPENIWAEHYHRRQENNHKGFFSAPWEPYRPMGGDVILDAYDLIVSTLPESVERRDKGKRRIRTVQSFQEPMKSSSDTSQKEDDKCSITTEELTDTAPECGFEKTRCHLAETNERLVAVRGGLPFEEHIKLFEARKKLEVEKGKPEEPEMVLMSMSHDVHLPPKQCTSYYLPSEVSQHSILVPTSVRSKSPSPISRSSGPLSTHSPKMTKTSKSPRMLGDEFSSSVTFANDDVVSTDDTKREDSELPSISTVQLMNIESGVSLMIRRKERMLRDHFLFLVALFNTLTAVQNMKTKELRSKTPLSKETLKSLMTESQQEQLVQQTNTVRNHRLSRSDIQPVATKLHQSIPVIGQEPSPGRNSPMCTEVDVPETARSKDVKRGSVHITAKKAMAVDTGQRTFTSRRLSRRAEELRPEGPVVETWEDLMNMQHHVPKRMHQYNTSVLQSSFGQQVGLLSKVMRWFRRSTVTPQMMEEDVKLLQLKLASPKGKATEKAPERESQGQMLLTHHISGHRKPPIWHQVAHEKSTVFVDNVKKPRGRQQPETAVKRARRDFFKLKRTLEKENKAELENLNRTKVANLRLKFSALNAENCSPLFEEQKYTVQTAKNNVSISRLDVDIKPTKWFQELEVDTENLLGSYEHKDISNLMTKMHKFALMDNKSVYLAKFVFDEVLLGQEEQFLEWLNHRKIPYVIVDENSPRQKP